MFEVCGDNRFEIIEKAKQDILDATNISTSPDEMKVLDSFLFRCWQMGWLKQYGGGWLPLTARLDMKTAAGSSASRRPATSTSTATTATTASARFVS